MEGDWFIYGCGLLATLIFGVWVAAPLWGAIRAEEARLPDAGGPGHLGVEGPRRRS